MSDHALLSPSSAKRWLICPGSVAMESTCPRTTSKAAEYGTACHQLAEWTLTKGYTDAYAFIGDTTDNGYIVNEDMVALINTYVKNVLDYAEGHTLLVEQRVDFSSYLGVPNSFGTSDTVIITQDGKELIIGDLKTGYHIVRAEENPQLMLYALGALYEFGMLGNFETVRLVIHQPSQHHLDEWCCSVDDLLRFGEEAKLRAQEAMLALESKDPVVVAQFLHPTEEGCQYCKRFATCPAATKKVNDTIGAQFEDLTADPVLLVPKDPVTLAQKMSATGYLENYIKAVRAEVERELLSGTEVPGWKIVQGKQGNRKWSDEKEVIKAMKALKLSKDQMYDSTLISPTNAEKLLKIVPDGWPQLERFVTRSEGAKSVAPESDKRPAIPLTPVADSFDDLTGNDLI